jgi:hypothetical protein
MGAQLLMALWDDLVAAEIRMMEIWVSWLANQRKEGEDAETARVKSWHKRFHFYALKASNGLPRVKA